MQVVGELPLEALGDLLLYAEQKETEKTIYPLWLTHYLFAQLSGVPHVEFNDMLAQVKGNIEAAKPFPNSKRSAEEIIKDFAPIVEQYRKAHSKGG